jgi:hypothetical protein
MSPLFQKRVLNLTLSIAALLFTHMTMAQVEMAAWGNIEGIRVDGELIAFESSVTIIGKDWSNWWVTGKERQQSQYSKKGKIRMSDVRMDSLFFVHKIENTGKGKVSLDLDFKSRVDSSIIGVFYQVNLPADIYENGNIQLLSPSEVPLSSTQPSSEDEILRAVARGIRVVTPTRNLEVTVTEPTKIIVKTIDNQWSRSIGVFFEIASGQLTKGLNKQKHFDFTASGDIDTETVQLTLDPSNPGRTFDGIGGNFRLQKPKTDPQVIDYSLENLRVAWARVELPWYFWHPDENTDPMTAELHPHVKNSMELAKKIYDQGIPIIIADWSAPDWAVEGTFSFRPINGVWGNVLDSTKTEKIYESLTNYMLYLKQNYGVEIEMFSFNESDLGINIRQTGQEHADLIKGLGAYMQAKGLKTKMLFGDTADIRGFWFLKEAMEDADTHPYMGAVSFHSWRGWSDENLLKWTEASRKMDLPLIVGEGSIDAAAWRYPAIFEEPLYARNEINLYVRIMKLCQPLSILQWQLTADYSALSGGGIYGNDSTELYPTQRFHNLQQLGATPKGLHYLPIESSRENVTCAALGSKQSGKYAIHLVNNGATRNVVLSNIPKKVKALRYYVTDENRGMMKGELIKVKKGQASFTLEQTSFVSLFTEN